MNPLERLLNLVALLKEARRPLTFDQISDSLKAYQQGDRASAKRQFERDKDLLRSIGIPVEVAPTDVWEDESGYHIPKDRYELPEISFTPEEAAALFIAAHSPADEGEAAAAFRKLAAPARGGVGALAAGGAPVGPDVAGPNLATVAEAVSDRRRVRFRYQAAQGEIAEREADAWALMFRKGSWYLVGRDRDRGEVRAYRLSRMRGPVRDTGEGEPRPADFDPAEHLAAGPWGLGEPDRVALIAFAPKVAWWAIAGIEGAKVLRTRDDGWVEAEVPAGADAFVAWVLSFGPDAELLEPADLRAAVVERLESVGAPQ